jgi:dsDNA-specific endonuclease/ATPase MutS2
VNDDADLDEASELAFEFSDVLDLHSFSPRDVPEIVTAWLDEAVTQGRIELRLIHGRGIGVQRERVRALLSRDARVLSFRDAPGDAGGWGATLITLARADPNPSDTTA